MHPLQYDYQRKKNEKMNEPNAAGLFKDTNFPHKCPVHLGDKK